MKKAPYTLKEAEQLCADFQHLVGKRYSKQDEATIECVAVVPFDAMNKERFIVYYHLLGDAHEALNLDYKGLLFDVLVMATYPNRPDLLYKDINSWYEEAGIVGAALHLN